MLKYIFILFLLFAGLSGKEAESSHVTYKVIEDEAKIPILNPEFKSQKTLKLELENGFQAYIVSDPEATQSSAALTVLTGSWDNPEESPGIAHFLEHMLFLGTKKYPIESEYDRFLAGHGGVSNAFTSPDYTSYLFAVSNNGFPEALDRFSSFFKEPLFNPSGVSRELNAIEQEYAIALDNETRRISFVLKDLAHPKHPFHYFDAGNKASLSNVSQDELRQWFESHYSTNLMRLFIYSSLPIEELKELVIKNFSSIPNKNLPRSSFSGPAMNQDFNGHIVYVKSNQANRSLNLIWELPKSFATEMRKEQPEKVICFLMNHQGKESLLAQLKREDLAEDIYCSGSLISYETLLFEVNITLTSKGLEQMDTVIERVFQAIKNMQQKEFPPYLLEDIRKIARICYQYQSREDAFLLAIKNGLYLAREGITTYPELLNTLDNISISSIKEFLSYLTPDRCLIILSTSPEELHIEYDKVEKWTGIPYKVQPFSEKQLKLFREAKPIPEIDLPKKNVFIPKDFELVSSTVISPKDFLNAPLPHELFNNDYGHAYYAPDFIYQTPKIYISYTIKSPFINNGNPQTDVMNELYITALEDTIDPLIHDAKMADVSFHVDKVIEGIRITLYGFRESIESFVEILGNAILVKDVPLEKFNTYKDSLRRKYDKSLKENPLTLAVNTLKGVILKNYVPVLKQYEALDNISLKKFNNFLTKIFAKTYTESIIAGNITQSKAQEAILYLQNSLKSKPYPVKEQLPLQVINLAQGKGPYYVKASSQAGGNAAVIGIEGEAVSIDERNKQAILNQAIRESFFQSYEHANKPHIQFIVFLQIMMAILSWY